jgi:acyl-[acyl-carrier-protein]-phospholipid O-acyltransferase/long-chain-fatty-acid--[acyl-carrier-protein] ligase
MTGVGAGLFVVPLQSFIQMRAPHGKLGEVWAAKAFMEWIGVLIASGLIWALESGLKLSPARSFLIIGAMTMVMTFATLKILPDFFVRFVVMVITRTVYRIREIGVENLPAEGPALLVANHVSMMDALQILAVQQRRIRFLMHRPIYERSRLRPLFKLMGAIPIAMEDPPRKILESLHAARAALDDGYLVCIFAEGALTRTGMMHDFRRGFERIVRGTDYPIIPVHIGGTWGSIFSHYYDPGAAKIPRQIPYPCTVIFGAPMPATSTAFQVRQAVMELSTEYFEDRKPLHRSLARSWASVARRNWSRHAMADTTGRRMTYGEALAGSLYFAEIIGKMTDGQKNVGILLPPTCVGALVNVALALLHKTAVNLNFTASAEAFQFAIKQSELKTIISSGAFLEKMPELANLPGLVKIEELTKRADSGAKLRAFLRARFLPVGFIARDHDCSPDDVATIIFSSGTTGEPKGVMLSQHNILSNIESLSMAFRPRQSFNIAATLPLFHSFGYTAGIWFPLLTGMAASYHVSPLDGGKIAEMVRENKCTALFATPTFLLAYIRKAKPEDFKSLIHVVCGAEKLKPRVAEAFQERFGITPLEGYGTTELSPVAALSIPDVNVDGVYQYGRKPGSVGQPVPGVAVRIVDPDTNEILPPGKPGLMLIKGPNVMLGYLGKPELTAEVIRDGWYRTGDIAQLDEEGFITITDRLARFSKIGGEMVPHGAIEDEFQRGLGKHEPVVAVSSVPDEKRGERIVVMFTDHAGDPAMLHEIMEKSPIPNLWKPAKNAYFKIDALPMTGTGKLDVKTLRKYALDAAEKAANAAKPTADAGT